MRIVFDTNVVLSALLFPKGRCAWLREFWVAGDIIPVVSSQTVRELLRVLEYPKFQLTAEDRETLLEDYLPYAESVVLPARLPHLPSCRDKDDLVFLAVAVVAQADALVTGDADLLTVTSKVSIPILTTHEFRRKYM